MLVTMAACAALRRRSVFRSFAAYWLTMLLAGAFTYGAILTAQGLAAQLLPRRLFLRFSGYLQLAAVCTIVIAYFVQPGFYSVNELVSAIRWLPSYWFLALYQQLNGSMHPALLPLAKRAWIGLAAVLCVTPIVYALSYWRMLSAIAADWGVSEKEAVDRLQPAGAVYWTMDEADVQRVLRFEHTMIGSDGLPHDSHPHPRLWGAFPRVLGHYSRDLGLFGLEEAVRRMTGLSAARLGLAGRGILALGAYADIAVFDPATIADRATFEAPMTPAAGIEHVFVNVRPVWTEGKPTGERPGRALRRQQMQAEPC